MGQDCLLLPLPLPLPRILEKTSQLGPSPEHTLTFLKLPSQIRKGNIFFPGSFLAALSKALSHHYLCLEKEVGLGLSLQPRVSAA